MKLAHVKDGAGKGDWGDWSAAWETNSNINSIKLNNERIELNEMRWEPLESRRNDFFEMIEVFFTPVES